MTLSFGLTAITAAGCGLVAGIFFAFSSFVMQALGRLPPAEGIAAMQSINMAVLRSLFMVVFLGTAALCLLLAGMSRFAWREARTDFLQVGACLYLIGSLLVTLVCNVPLNNALARAEPASAEGAALWARYLADWTAWNTVRMLAALLAMATFFFQLRTMTQIGGAP